MSNIDVEDIRSTLAAEMEKASATPADDAPLVEPVEAPTGTEAEDSPPSASDRRERDDQGRFAKAAADKAAKEKNEVPAEQKPAEQKPATEAQTEQAPAPTTSAPPPGWSPASKAAWHEGKLPPSVLADVAKREKQVADGLSKLQSFKPLEPYMELARKGNTTLPEALERYVAAEQLLERDPVQGLRMLAQNYNVDLRQVLGGMSAPDQIPQPRQQNYDLAPVLTPIQQELAQLRQIVHGDKQAQTQSQVEAFFSDPANRYADNVADEMKYLIETGRAKNLKDAYDQAVWLNPEVRTEVMREQTTSQNAAAAARAKDAAAAAKKSGRSINGGPSAGTVATEPKTDDLRQTLVEAFAGRV